MKNNMSIEEVTNLLTASVRRKEGPFVAWYKHKQVALAIADAEEINILVDKDGEYTSTMYTGPVAQKLKGLGIPFELTQDPTCNVNQASAILNACVRSELRDHAFGDAEVTWFLPASSALGDHNIEVAYGHFGGEGATVGFVRDENDDRADRPRLASFKEDAARSLRQCGLLGAVERNDSEGPDGYTEGTCMPGLTLDGVRKELLAQEIAAIR